MLAKSKLLLTRRRMSKSLKAKLSTRIRYVPSLQASTLSSVATSANKLMVDGQNARTHACEQANVLRYIASDWSLNYTKLEFGQLFPKDPMKHVKAYLETKKMSRASTS